VSPIGVTQHYLKLIKDRFSVQQDWKRLEKKRRNNTLLEESKHRQADKQFLLEFANGVYSIST
jgi:hypothetical protein